MGSFLQVIKDMKDGGKSRILAFGSSNTRRRTTGMHWVDCLDLALVQSCSGSHTCINAGIDGDTTEDLLGRFEEDAAFYRPHAAFITIGGNDYRCPGLSRERFGRNLLELHRRFSDLGCAVVFQTYYAPDASDGTIAPVEVFYDYMQIVRDVAAETGCDLVDHLARWEPFRRRHYDFYLMLMQDSFHLKCAGNMVMGLDIARTFGLQLGVDAPETWRFPRTCQALMDLHCADAASP